MVASIKPHRGEIGLADGLLLIDGSWAAARSGENWSHSHPATGEEVASFPIAGPADVDAAVRAARKAFDEGPWPRARATERIRVLRRIADLVREHGDELLAQKAAPALAAGCTIVAKPSEYATFAVLRLAALMEEAGLPPGVLNIVTGPGEPTGDALINHPMVDKLSFTGSRALAARSSPRPRPGSSGSAWSWAARARRWYSPTPTCPPPRRSPWARSPWAWPGRSAWPRPGRWYTGTWPTSSSAWPR
jgi:hypothetical protein